jgi:glycosyltransferase involved in cell wall biosynthesis
MNDQVLSVVAPVRNGAAFIGAFVEETIAAISGPFPYHELVVVDDGSTDETLEILEGLLKKHPGIRVICLSRPMGEDIAMTAGLEQVIGDLVVTMSPGSDPPAFIPTLVAELHPPIRIVVGTRASRSGQGLVSRLGAWIFYRVTQRLLGVRLPANATQFRAMDRRALNATLRIKDRLRHLRLLALQTGYPIATVSYEPISGRHPQPDRSFFASLSLAVDMSVAIGRRPLRLVSLLGVIGSVINLVYALYVIAIFLFKNEVAEGWTTLSLEISLMFFLLFALLAVLCEYIGHILLEMKDRPLYAVSDEFSSDVAIPSVVRPNVVESVPDPAAGAVIAESAG